MFTGVILKVTNFCNLNCSYCYMFNSSDKTYTGAPKKMSVEISKKILDNILNYCIHKKQAHFHLTFHGGEPILWGQKNFKDFFDYYKELEPQFKLYAINLSFSLQTNGYVIDYDILNILKENKVVIGISLDGPKKYHDKYRVNHGGAGSYQKIIDNVENIINKGFGDILGGFLTVINTNIEPEEYFKWILKLPITRVDVLYPIEFNYTNLPWNFYGMGKYEYSRSPVIGRWLSQLFLLWYKYDNPNVQIRKFSETIAVIFGRKSHGDQMVNDQLGLIVVDSDGAIEYHDYFRGFKDGIIKTPYSLATNDFLSLENDFLFNKLFNLKEFLPKACKNCNLKHLCGGGFLPGRLKNDLIDIGRNKSVLCNDHYEYYFNVVKCLFQQLGIEGDVDEAYLPPVSFKQTVSKEVEI